MIVKVLFGYTFIFTIIKDKSKKTYNIQNII